MSVIKATNVYKVFGKKPTQGVQALKDGKSRSDLQEQGLTAAVIDASFEVDASEIFVVMGLSGSGKSTLIRMVNGLYATTDGTMELMGSPISELSEDKLRAVRRDKVSMVFQHFALLPHRTVGENAAYALKVQGVGKAEREKAAREALELVGLKGWETHKPGQLSGGMRQRVGLARALAAKTDILLMDEAFSALDPLIRREMQDQLIELQQKLGKTILFITHDLNEAMRLGDRIAMMRDGRIEQIGTAEQILDEPANNYVAQFVQDVDRSRVLTAANVMEPPVAVLGAEGGPQAAHKLMRENQLQWLLVQQRDRTPYGILWESDVADAVRRQRADLPWSPDHEMPLVALNTPIAELFALAAKHKSPLVVVDDDGRVEGVIPRVTLLAAAGYSTSDGDADTGALRVLRNGVDGLEPAPVENTGERTDNTDRSGATAVDPEDPRATGGEAR